MAPIVALDDVPLACEIATGLAGRLGEELNLPVFLYGEVATDPTGPCRATSAAAGWRSSVARSRRASSRPTTGPRLHPTAGAALVGVRLALIALNVWLPDGTSPTPAPSPPACARPAAGRRACRALGPLPARGRDGAGVDEHRGLPGRAARRHDRGGPGAAESLGVDSGDAELVGSRRGRPARAEPVGAADPRDAPGPDPRAPGARPAPLAPPIPA